VTDRPNRIGVTVCRVIGVGPHRIDVVSLDAVDGTPMFDVKPYLEEFGTRGEVHQATWATELMANYWKEEYWLDGSQRGGLAGPALTRG
jgi:tRNA (Thr-GGU) A37 N-methylase